MIGWFARRLGSPRFTAAAGRLAPFAGVAEAVVTGDPLVAVDRTITRWFHQHSVGVVTSWMASLISLSVAFSRVYLGTHDFSHVPGGPSLE